MSKAGKRLIAAAKEMRAMADDAIPADVIELAGEICSRIAEYGEPAQETIAAALMAERLVERNAICLWLYDYDPDLANAIMDGKHRR